MRIAVRRDDADETTDTHIGTSIVVLEERRLEGEVDRDVERQCAGTLSDVDDQDDRIALTRGRE